MQYHVVIPQKNILQSKAQIEGNNKAQENYRTVGPSITALRP